MTLDDVRELAAKHHDRKVDEFIAIVKREYLKREWEWVEPKLKQLLDDVMDRRKRFFVTLMQQAESAS